MRMYAGKSEHGPSFIKCTKMKLCKINAWNEVELYSILKIQFIFPPRYAC